MPNIMAMTKGLDVHEADLPARDALSALLRQWQDQGALHLANPTIAAEQFLLLATRGKRRLTDTILWDEAEALAHAHAVIALFWR